MKKTALLLILPSLVGACGAPAPLEPLHVEECTAWIKTQIDRPETFSFRSATGAGSEGYRGTYVSFVAKDASDNTVPCAGLCMIRGSDNHFAGGSGLFDKDPGPGGQSGRCRLSKAGA